MVTLSIAPARMVFDWMNPHDAAHIEAHRAIKEPMPWILAGHAVFTLRSKRTGTRYTYKVVAPTETTEAGGKRKNRAADVRFVSVLTGPDNEADYSFIGTIFLRGNQFRYSAKAHLNLRDPSIQAFMWFWGQVSDFPFTVPDQCEFWHEGSCGRCGRRLTDLESISSGYGPECINKI